jgi:ferritin-like protein
MNIEKIVELLIKDLANEYAHMHFYMQASTNVSGLHRQEIGELFKEQAQSEMNHVDQFRRMIQGIITRRGLNLKVPSEVSEFDKDLNCPVDLLKFALKMEDQVVSNYVTRHAQAEELAENGGEDFVDGTYIGLFLEDQILDSRGDADNIREMLKNAIDS